MDIDCSLNDNQSIFVEYIYTESFCNGILCISQ